MPARLDWWAFHRPETAKNTTVARIGLQHRAAVFTLIEILAGIGRHGLGFLETTFRASDARLQYEIGHCRSTAFSEKTPSRERRQPRTNCHENNAERFDFRGKCRRPNRAAKNRSRQKRQPATTCAKQKSQRRAEYRKTNFSIHRMEF